MRPLKPEQWVLLGLALAAVAWATVYVVGRTSHGNGLSAPEHQPLPEDYEARLRVEGMTGDMHSHLCYPHEHHAGYTYTRHRYPRSVGGEVSTLIHRGWSQMRIPNEGDVQWIISPPSEVAW